MCNVLFNCNDIFFAVVKKPRNNYLFLVIFAITVQLRYNIYLTNLLFVCCFERINVFSTHRAFSQIILEICQPESEKFQL